MADQKRNIFIGVAWPYVNGDLHIGHLAGYLLPADIAARYHRLIGDNVLMASGSDCHGTPTTIEADKRGKTPTQIADEYHAHDVDLFENVLKLTYDIYTRTDTAHHAEITQQFFLAFLEQGYISIKTTPQYYSDIEQRFLPDRYIEGTCPHCGFNGARSDQCDNCGKLLEQGEVINPTSKISQTEAHLKDTQHYFIDWPKLQPQIAKYVNQNKGNWKEWVAQETFGWLAEGLKPRAITRDIDWGVAIPVDKIPQDMRIDNIEHKRFYVWFDAVIGYYSASLLWAKEHDTSWELFWFTDNGNQSLKHYYFMGKDNLAFHTMFWPGQLMTLNPKLKLPDVPSINMFLNLDGKQFSKSRGVVIDSRQIVEKFGNDRVRFYLTLIMPEKTDSSFSWEDFQEKVNSILIGNLGNFIHRTLSIGQGSDMEKINTEILDTETQNQIQKAFDEARKHLETCEFRAYLEDILTLSGYGNKLFDHQQVWKLKKENPQGFNHSMRQLYTIIIALNYLIQPLLFETAERLADNLGTEKLSQWPAPGDEIAAVEKLLAMVNTATKPTPLFSRIELD